MPTPKSAMPLGYDANPRLGPSDFPVDKGGLTKLPLLWGKKRLLVWLYIILCRQTGKGVHEPIRRGSGVCLGVLAKWVHGPLRRATAQGARPTVHVRVTRKGDPCVYGFALWVT